MRTTDDLIDALQGPILVTGASGFIGANLFLQLAARRDDVYAVVREHPGWRLEGVDRTRTIDADLTDRAAVAHLVTTIRPKTVFDCVAYGAYSFESKIDLIYRTNLLSVINMVEALAEGGLAAYVHAGSSSEYGTNCTAPTEEAPRRPDSHYAVSKSAVADYIGFVGRHRAVPIINLRLYSVYGPLEDTSRLIPTLLRAAQAGTFPPFVDGRISRDFVHVEDVCEAFVRAALRLHPDLWGASLNIGTGVCTTIESLATLTGRLFAIPEAPQFNTMPERAWDLPDWYADPSAAERAIGWRATITLEEGLRRTAEWVAAMPEEQVALATKAQAPTRRRSVSAIVACYQDAQAIPHMYRRLTETFTALGIEYEIIFVNDASPDDSAEVITALSATDPHVLGITHSRNFGSQMAFRSGMELSSKDAVVLLDGDLQDPPELIREFYAQWEAGWDVVYGRRIKREMPVLRGLMYKAFYRVFAAFSYVSVPHDAGDFSLIDRKVVRWLLTCPERDLFIRGLRAYVGFRQTGVDYHRPERMFGRSTNNLLKNIGWAKKGIFSFSDTPLTMLTASGVALLGVSLVAAAILAILRLTVPDIAPRGITTVLITVLFFGALNLFAIGIVGEYVAKIMAEVKGRPRLIRSALIRDGRSTELVPEHGE